MLGQQPVSLQAILQTVQTVMETTLGERQFRCRAEVLQAKLHKGRIYLDLVEYSIQGTVLAKAKAIIREEELLEHYLLVSGIGSIEWLPGKIIMFEGCCRFHQQWWLSITILSLSEEFARGQLLQQQAALRASLEAAGIYGLNKQTTIASLPCRLAIISSPNSQGLYDFQSVIAESDFHVSRQLFAASIHGEPAKKEVAEQLVRIAACCAAEQFTALLIVRGGGGGEGLLRQNDPEIAARICQMPIPVILATGHTSDTSLLDELVRHAAKTPTDAAYVVLGFLEELNANVCSSYATIQDYIQETFALRTTQITSSYEDIQERVTALLITIWQTVQHARGIIAWFSPLSVLNKWYALLQTKQGAYLSWEEIQNLQTDDQLVVQTANRKFLVCVEKMWLE